MYEWSTGTAYKGVRSTMKTNWPLVRVGICFFYFLLLIIGHLLISYLNRKSCCDMHSQVLISRQLF